MFKLEKISEDWLEEHIKHQRENDNPQAAHLAQVFMASTTATERYQRIGSVTKEIDLVGHYQIENHVAVIDYSSQKRYKRPEKHIPGKYVDIWSSELYVRVWSAGNFDIHQILADSKKALHLRKLLTATGEDYTEYTSPKKSYRTGQTTLNFSPFPFILKGSGASSDHPVMTWLAQSLLPSLLTPQR
jgi:hypothetical protein